MRREQAVQAEGVALRIGEGGALVEQRCGDQRVAADADGKRVVHVERLVHGVVPLAGRAAVRGEGHWPVKSIGGRGLPALSAFTAEGRPRRTSSLSKSGMAISNMALSAAATPDSAQIRSSALWAA